MTESDNDVTEPIDTSIENPARSDVPISLDMPIGFKLGAIAAVAAVSVIGLGFWTQKGEAVFVRLATSAWAGCF